ncbi:MAG: response regulator transcription factor [Geminicoccaceae bacterium]
MRIVLVDDNEMLANGVQKALHDVGHAVDWLADGIAGNDFLASSGADLAIIDVNLPGMNGFDVLRALRRRGDHMPVLMLTARGETSDRVIGLDAGADDYLVKPFAIAELLARIRALARRRAEWQPDVIALGSLHFDRAARRLDGPSGEIQLPRREMALFEFLLDHRGRIASKEAIVDALYGTGADIEANAVELLISRLRRKLAVGDVAIRTARGLGYMLDDAADPS